MALFCMTDHRSPAFQHFADNFWGDATASSVIGIAAPITHTGRGEGTDYRLTLTSPKFYCRVTASKPSPYNEPPPQDWAGTMEFHNCFTSGYLPWLFYTPSRNIEDLSCWLRSQLWISFWMITLSAEPQYSQSAWLTGKRFRSLLSDFQFGRYLFI